ncbi:MAG: glutamine--tRNA ligase/YqeY domain fusion protein [Trueperaceae bacterium]
MTTESSGTSRIPDDEKRIVAPNFITEIVEADLRSGWVEQVVTRFPPEPNGYLHIGHLKAIVLAFGVADDYRGRTNLRFDDTNPTTESDEYVQAIKRDIEWLGFEWDEQVHASDYFERLYGYAVKLIESGKAYVDSLSEAEIREHRGTVTEAGRPSPYRERSPAENLELFGRMRTGEFAEGAHVLRAKIDMASRNMIMRDPLLYRIRHAHHYRTGDSWHVYPMYDFAHPLSDAIEGVSHSLCTLEFENNREFYDWLLEQAVPEPRPRQYEFARLNLEYTVLSKRRLIELVKGGFVSGWDDPRMPTVAGMRRRGVTPEALRDFVNRVGVTRSGSRTDMALLEHSIRDDLNSKAPRVLAVIDPLRVVLSNYPTGSSEELAAPYWPHDVPREGSRPVRFARELFIERADFAESPPKGWRRLSPGTVVRLRHGYVIRCDEAKKDDQGNVTELICSYDTDTLNRNPQGRPVRGTIHWVDAHSAVPAEFRLYDRLFVSPDPADSEDEFSERINSDSLVVRHGLVEASLGADAAQAGTERRYQFERLGYFWPDPEDSRPSSLVFNRIVTLKDSWERMRSDTRTAAAKADPPATRKAAPSEPIAELTAEQRALYSRYRDTLGVDEHDSLLLATDDALARFFEAAVSRHDNPGRVANWIVNELLRELKGRSLGELPLTPEGLADLVGLIDSGTISARAGKEVFAAMLASGESPGKIVEMRSLRQLSDESAIAPIVERLLAANPEKVRAYREGKTGLSGFFVGQVMRETGGRANPQLVKDVLERELT